MSSVIPVVMPVILVWIVDTWVRAIRIITNRVVATRVIAIGIIAIRVTIRVAIWIGINISHLIPLRVGWNGIHC
jgi:membrane protein CcdC involved in cytochrome C biogenesis